jgi:hypothetical protein
MERVLRLGVVIGLAAAVWTRAAETSFSRSLGSAEFAAAGLSKLSPEELARLDALVQDFTRAPVAATPDPRESRTTVGADRPAAAERRTSEPPERRSLLERAKVTIAPGTKVEYEPVQSRLNGTFTGWQPRAVFDLENGQRWQVTGTDSYVCPPVSNPAVKITPGALGSFWMTIDGVNPRVRVAPVSR